MINFIKRYMLYPLVAATAVLCGVGSMAGTSVVSPVRLHELWLETMSNASNGGLDFRDWGILTISEDETYKLVNVQKAKDGSKFQDLNTSWVYPAPAIGLVPLYRYYSNKIGDTFFTTDSTEGNNFVKYQGYILQGTCCYISPISVAGTVPLHRYLEGKVHLYTSGNWEAKRLEMHWIDQGIAGYVWPAANRPPTLGSGGGPAGGSAVLPLGFYLRKNAMKTWIVTVNRDESNGLYADTRNWESPRLPQTYAFPPSIGKKGMIALSRYKNPATGEIFFSSNLDAASARESDALLNAGYLHDGVCCFLASTQRPGTIPLYRMGKGKQMVWLPGDAGRDWAKSKGMQFQKIEGYVWVAPPEGQPPPDLNNF